MSEEKLVIYSDGGARGNPGPAAAAFIINRNGRVIHSQAEYLGISTNNFAEYSGVLIALTWLKRNPNQIDGKVKFFLDSELVVNQLKGEYKIKNLKLKEVMSKIKNIEKDLKNKIEYDAIPRTKNKIADHLVNKVLNEKLTS